MAHTFYHHENSPRHDRTSLSGETMSDSANGPEAYLATAPNMSSRSTTKSKRYSNTSTNKTQSRQMDRGLIDMLQDIQTELVTHRSIMLDMQARLSQLESASSLDHKPNVPSRYGGQNGHDAQTERTSSAAREARDWWNSCQKLLQSRGPPSNASEFLKSPARFSGFDFNFDLLKTIPDMPTVTPRLDDVPGLTPSSDRDYRLEQGLDTYKEVYLSPTHPRTLYHEAMSDIKEHIVEFDRIRITAPWILSSPPRSARSRSTVSWFRGDDMTVLPAVLVPTPVHPPRSYWIKNLFTNKTLLKSQKAEPGHLTERRSGLSLRF
ncbi:hypothetical protein EJ02DRAFT_73713 [Clathrospora elynae]|uniref:Uncharacterized protein n=1 Tax=Clathrospora elynae TaxID=706981 RepID=A0A6A5S845_9PLEO|nr:hypothetical protein EJ02DRAFT_73713 [Clathrospora elynae]